MDRVGIEARTAGRLLACAGAILVAGCIPRRDPPPPPKQQSQPQVQQPEPSPPTAPAAAGRDWRDIPLTPGNWYYSTQATGSQALFGPANSEAAFIVRCDSASRKVLLSRAGMPSASTMTIQTSSGSRSLPAAFQREPLPYLTASVAASDPFLDSMAFSRGRITVAAQGLPMLVIPAWAEPAKVVEDCRS